MRAVTLRHPWAYAVKMLGKDIENRTWDPGVSLKVGERFAIHAGKPPRANSCAASDFAYWSEIAEALDWIESVGIVVPRYSPLATDLTAREVNAQRTEADRDFH